MTAKDVTLCSERRDHYAAKDVNTAKGVLTAKDVNAAKDETPLQRKT